MISNNITGEDVLNALSEIDKNGIPSNRHSKKYFLDYKGKRYPPKYVLSLANKYANKNELDPNEFSGGDETNDFLIKLGFDIKENHEIAPYVSDGVTKSLVVTAIIESNGKHENKTRLLLLEDIIIKIDSGVNILILPAGFVSYANISEKVIKTLENQIAHLLRQHQKEDTVICFGIDADKGKHQLGLAISINGIVALGRKFFPTDDEKDEIQKANTSNDKEFGFERAFNWKGKNYFIAVCYDSFGIKKMKLSNSNIDYIIDLIHGFYPKGEGQSGEAYFARHGLAGASKTWKCPAFGSAVFFNRTMPHNWPSGIIWNKGKLSTQIWKYIDNPLKPFRTQKVSTKEEKVIMRYFLS